MRPQLWCLGSGLYSLRTENRAMKNIAQTISSDRRRVNSHSKTLLFRRFAFLVGTDCIWNLPAFQLLPVRRSSSARQALSESPFVSSSRRRVRFALNPSESTPNRDSENRRNSCCSPVNSLCGHIRLFNGEGLGCTTIALNVVLKCG